RAGNARWPTWRPPSALTHLEVTVGTGLGVPQVVVDERIVSGLGEHGLHKTSLGRGQIEGLGTAVVVRTQQVGPLLVHGVEPGADDVEGRSTGRSCGDHPDPYTFTDVGGQWCVLVSGGGAV